MLFSYNWLKDYINGDLPKPRELGDILTMHSFEVEEVERKKNDYIFDIDILPNRSHDCLSHIGVAKEVAVLTNTKFKAPISKIKRDKNLNIRDFISVIVKDKKACPRYTAMAISGVKVGTSPKWLKNRLEICGLRSINNIVDIVNYVMLETGQPLHIFDYERIKGGKIIVRFANNGEKIVTLDGDEYSLEKDILVIADSEDPMVIAGIKGGITPEISKSTKTIVIESANFDADAIRKASMKLKLRTDASIRFGHGISPELTMPAILRASYLIQKIAGGKVAKGFIDIYPKKFAVKRIRLDLNYVLSLLGVRISEREIVSILKKLGFKILSRSSLQRGKRKRFLLVQVPVDRLDVNIQEDLIEEIGRVYGYEKITPVFPLVSSVPPRRNLKVFWEDVVKDILCSLGFVEVYNYSFMSEKMADVFGCNGCIELENPMNSEQKYLRPSLIPNLLKNIKANQKLVEIKNKQIMIFELGKIFRDDFVKKTSAQKFQADIDYSFKERNHLTGLITGDSFYQLKGIVDSLFNKIGISGIWYDQYLPASREKDISVWDTSVSARVMVGNDEVGFLGEISPFVLEKLKISKRVVAFDLDFELLSKLASEENEYRPISRYPATVRDLAVLVPFNVKVVDILNKVNAAGGPLVRDVDIFDIYEGDNIPNGKKNIAFHIIYQAKDRTLSASDVQKIEDKIIASLEEDPEWEVRR